MNLNELHNKLITAARCNPPADTVPYGFETRIMARLAGRPCIDPWALWATALWRAAVPCLAVTFILCAWAWISPHPAHAPETLASDMDNTVFAALDNPGDAW